MRTQLYLTPRDHGRPLTFEEFQSAETQEGYKYELIEGRLEVFSWPRLPHEELRDWLARKLYSYSLLNPEVLNEVKSPSCLVLLEEEDEVTALQPDLTAYQDYPHHLPLRDVDWDDLRPVLVAEVISPDTSAKDLQRNVRIYLQVPSIREYWILDPRPDPDQPSLTVYRRRGERWQKAIEVAYGETYTTKLLPGFVLVVDPRQ